MARLVGVLRCGLPACVGWVDQGEGHTGTVTWELAEPLLVEASEKWGIEMVKILV